MVQLLVLVLVRNITFYIAPELEITNFINILKSGYRYKENYIYFLICENHLKMDSDIKIMESMFVCRQLAFRPHLSVFRDH